jgi:hypothetical protein
MLEVSYGKRRQPRTGGKFPTEAPSGSSFSHFFEFAATNMSLTLVGRAAGAEVYSSPRDRTCPREYYRYALISFVLMAMLTLAAAELLAGGCLPPFSARLCPTPAFVVTLPRWCSFTLTHLPSRLRIIHPLAAYTDRR